MASCQVRLGEVLAGRYRVDRELGAGAMGVVYAAWHLELDHPVALKVVTAPITDVVAATARFRREVRAAAKIRSEHVARVLDVGALETGLPYMVLELLEGNDLERELALNGPVSISEAVDYVLQTIEALAEAHAAGIVHRDLKPANLFLAERPDKTRLIKVLDFGISKSLLGDSASGQLSLTQTGMMMGSPLYMSPEQMASSRDTDARCDIWALGVVLYQLLSGTTPFCGDSILALCAAVFRDRPAPLSGFRSDVPEELERVIIKCLERDREQRYGNVGELALALVDFAPSHARVHCERANRVLFPSAALCASPSTETDTVPRVAQSPGFAPTAVGPETQAVWNSSRNARAPSLKWKVGGMVLLVAVAAGVVPVYSFFSRRAQLTSTVKAATPTVTGEVLGTPVPAPEGATIVPVPISTTVLVGPEISATSFPSVTPAPLDKPQAAAAPHARANDASAAPTARKASPKANTMAWKAPRFGPTLKAVANTKEPGRAGGTELPDYGGRR